MRITLRAIASPCGHRVERTRHPAGNTIARVPRTSAVLDTPTAEAASYSPNCQQVLVAPIKLITPLSSAPDGYENANW